MKTLYDVLGIRPDDDAEALKRAFRNSVRASHPDVHPRDPDAPVRFRQAVKAYAVLRDPETRADYDRLLELEREQLRATARRYTVRKFVFDGIAAASLAAVMAGGYTLLADIPSSVKMTKVVAGPWHGSTEIDALSPSASTDTTNQDDLGSAANSGGAPGDADSEPASSTAIPDMLAANVAGAFGATIYQAHMNGAAAPLKSVSGAEPLDPEPTRSVGLQRSVERNNAVPRSSSSDFGRAKTLIDVTVWTKSPLYHPLSSSE
jgi:curved DNA-binding protein CbpA